MESFSSSASPVSSFDDHFAHNMWNILLELLFIESRLRAFAYPLLLKLTGSKSHCLILPLISSATKKVRMILHDDSSGTFANGDSSCYVAPFTPRDMVSLS